VNLKIVGEIEDLTNRPDMTLAWNWYSPLMLTVLYYVRHDRPIEAGELSKSPLANWKNRACYRRREADKLWQLFRSIRARGYHPRKGDEIKVAYAANNLWFVNGAHRAAVLKAMASKVPALLLENEK